MNRLAPWLPELADMGIDYLAGVAVTDPTALRQTIAEGGEPGFLIKVCSIAS